MKEIILLLLLIFSFNNELLAQNKDKILTFGYFAPYAVQVGGKLGLALEMTNWESGKAKKTKINHLEIHPQIGYFTFPNVQNNLLIQTDINYRRHQANKKLYPIAGISLAYLLSSQKVDGAVDLATGTISPQRRGLHYFVPSVHLGIRKVPKKRLGYYGKVFYGQKMSPQVEGAGFWGLELGGLFYLN